jgi:hypothetical protein
LNNQILISMVSKEKPKQIRPNKKSRRDEELWNVYGEIITKHGEYASRIKKSELYEEVADRVYLSSGRVRNILSKMFKNRSDPRSKCQMMNS